MKDINWQLEWQKGTFSGAAQTYVELGLKPTSRAESLPELRFKREVQGWLIAARSGHGHFSAYHERFGHEETDADCVCGQRRAQLHPFSCPKAREHRLHLWCEKRQRQYGLDVFGEGEDDGVQEWSDKIKALTLLNFLFIFIHSSGKEKPMYIIWCTIDRKAT